MVWQSTLKVKERPPDITQNNEEYETWDESKELLGKITSYKPRFWKKTVGILYDVLSEVWDLLGALKSVVFPELYEWGGKTNKGRRAENKPKYRGTKTLKYKQHFANASMGTTRLLVTTFDFHTEKDKNPIYRGWLKKVQKSTLIYLVSTIWIKTL